MTHKRYFSHILPNRFCTCASVAVWSRRPPTPGHHFQPHPPQPILYVCDRVCTTNTTPNTRTPLSATPSPADSLVAHGRLAHPSHALADTLPRSARRAPPQYQYLAGELSRPALEDHTASQGVEPPQERSKRATQCRKETRHLPRHLQEPVARRRPQAPVEGGGAQAVGASQFLFVRGPFSCLACSAVSTDDMHKKLPARV